MTFFLYLLIALGLVLFLNYQWPHFLWKLAALVLLVCVGYKSVYPSYSWRQKITVEVETPSGLIVGSSVQAAGYDISPRILPDAGTLKRWLKGEAVVLEVRPGKYLFALLKGKKYQGDAKGVAWYLLQSRFKGDDHRIGRHLEGNREVHELFDEYKPMMVTFTDINDPASVMKVEPYDLAAHFGPGVKLKRITLEMTGAAVTTGRVEQVLGWWNNLKIPIGGSVDRTYGDSLYALGKWDFIRR